MKKYIMIVGLLFTCSCLLMACGGSNESSSKDNDGEEGSTNTGGDSLPDTMEIDEEVREDGVTLTLDSISFEDNYIAVDFNVVNTTGHAVELAAEGSAEDDDLGGLILEDDTGNEYRYIAEGNEQRIKLSDGEKLTGSINFEGKLQGDAETLNLRFNPDEDQSNERTPIFSFENIKIKR